MMRWPSLLVAFATISALVGCSKEVRKEPTSKVYREASAVREGKIAAVERSRVTFWNAEDPAGEPVTLALTNDTTYVKGGNFVDRGKLSEGEMVRVFYDETQEHPTALRVEILSGQEADQIKKRVEDVIRPMD